MALIDTWRTRIGRAPAPLGAALALLLCACAAATPPAGTGPPRQTGQAYPVTLAPSEERRDRALAAWKGLLGGQATAAAPAPELWPVTATLRALPAGLSAPLRLPLIRFEEGEERSEEATRESLRRFIEAAAPLVTDEPGELSLVGVEEEAGGTRRARYQQKPFDLPLRNGYGVVEVAFTPDLRVVGLSSTAIPDNNRLQRALTNARQQIVVRQAAASLADRPLTFGDAAGNRQTRTARAEEISARELVVYPAVGGGAGASLELRLAWEMRIEGGGGAPFLVYVDAVTGEQIEAAPAPAPAPGRPGSVLSP